MSGDAGVAVGGGSGTAIWGAVPDLEAQNRAPLVDSASADSSTAIGAQGSTPSAEPSPIVNPNPAVLAGVKFKTTYEFELDLSAKLFLFLVGLEIAFFVFDRAYINPPEDADGMWLLGCMIITVSQICLRYDGILTAGSVVRGFCRFRLSFSVGSVFVRSGTN